MGHLTDAERTAAGNNGAGVRQADAVSPRVPAPLTPAAPSNGIGGSSSSMSFSGYEEVRRLAAQGFSETEIAQRTHRGREEIRLLLRLNQAAQPTPTAQPNEGL